MKCTPLSKKEKEKLDMLSVLLIIILGLSVIVAIWVPSLV